MKRALIFAKRCLVELLRDPLSYIFCVAFPLAMLGIMTAVNGLIPPETNMTVFRIENLTPGIAEFGFSFVMLFASLTVSKDRSGAFLVRLYSSPLRGGEFVGGYALSHLALAVGQILLIYAVGGVIALTQGTGFSFGRAILSMLAMLPAAVFFLSAGVLFGTVLGEKTAPPCSSILITMSGILGGVWFDVSSLPEDSFFRVLADILPFANATAVGRAVLSGGTWLAPFVNTVLWAVGAFLVAALVFRARMNADLK